jgi:hypothetical protein
MSSSTDIYSDGATNVLERLINLISRTERAQWEAAAAKRKDRHPVPERAVSWVFLKELEDGLRSVTRNHSTDKSSNGGAVPRLPTGTRVLVQRLLGGEAMVANLLLERFSQPAVCTTVREALDRLCAELGSKQKLVHELLQRLDHYGDGLLSCDELRHGLRSTGVSLQDSELDGVMRAFDRNGDGFVDYVEFYSVLSKHRAGQATSEDRNEPESAYNGRLARVLSFDEHGGRYIVVLDEGTELSLKPECVGLNYDDLNSYAHQSPSTLYRSSIVYPRALFGAQCSCAGTRSSATRRLIAHVRRAKSLDLAITGRATMAKTGPFAVTGRSAYAWRTLLRRAF